MRTLPQLRPTAEQLPIIQNNRPGVSLIRGAAGSGKTTTALLRLKQLAASWLARRQRLELDEPIRILVITYNRTLRGYVAALAENQLRGRSHLVLTVSTFSKWVTDELLPHLRLLDFASANRKLNLLSEGIPLSKIFIHDEVDYILGRFLPSDLDAYLDCERTGRGASPRVDRNLRQSLLTDVIGPYSDWKNEEDECDWSDYPTRVLSYQGLLPKYDVIIADEVQDLSANQIRALLHVAADPSSVTFILDAAQRIYPRGFTWREVGLRINPNDSYRLPGNYRNTREICQFALPLLQGMNVGDDGTFPDFHSCARNGPKPIVLKGKYSKQVHFAIHFISNHVDLQHESVAFLHPKGGGWFSFLEKSLDSASFAFVDLTRQPDWPTGPENIALSTMHSVKGLEFDHVIILGLNSEVTPSGPELDDVNRESLRRLLAMSITRARTTVILGYKPSEASDLIGLLDPSTYDEYDV